MLFILHWATRALAHFGVLNKYLAIDYELIFKTKMTQINILNFSAMK
jgi:hypothetical protein